MIIIFKGFSIHSSDYDDAHLHGHKFLEFTYVARGTMEHYINGETIITGAGDYYIVDYGTKHSYKRISKEKLWVINFLFYPEFLDRTLVGKTSFEDIFSSYIMRFCYKALTDSPTGKVFHDDDGAVGSIVKEIENEYYQKSYGYLECIRGLLIKLLIFTVRKTASNHSTLPKSELIEKVCDYIQENFASKLTLYQIAEKFNYSTGYLSVQFSKEMKMTFSDYLQQIRTENACFLLANTDMPIGDIANSVGYSDIKFFNELFKKRLGITPREFKKLSNIN